jgi:predicted SAM-dependent methyltransferase
LGASGNRLDGWLNSDVLPGRGMIYLDVTTSFPFEDNVIDYIFAEHLIEHVEHADAVTMLRESWRVLKPGGQIRIATPDLGVLLALHTRSSRTEAQQNYVDWIIERCMPSVDGCKEVFVINNAFHAWGHRFLYDQDTLRLTVSKVGFTDIRLYRPGDSADPHLRGLEAHGAEIGNESINRFETFVIEGRAVKP